MSLNKQHFDFSWNYCRSLNKFAALSQCAGAALFNLFFFFFIANSISDNLWWAANPRASTWHFCAGLLLVYTDKKTIILALLWLKALISAGVLMISKEIKCSLSACTCVHVFMSMHSDARLGSFGCKIQAPEPCIAIVSQLQRISLIPQAKEQLCRQIILHP